MGSGSGASVRARARRSSSQMGDRGKWLVLPSRAFHQITGNHKAAGKAVRTLRGMFRSNPRRTIAIQMQIDEHTKLRARLMKIWWPPSLGSAAVCRRSGAL